MSQLGLGLLIGIFSGGIVGFIIAYVIRTFFLRKKEQQVAKKLEYAEETARKTIQSARNNVQAEIIELKKVFQDEITERKKQSIEYEEILLKREKNIVEREGILDLQNREVFEKKESLRKLQSEYDNKLNDVVIELERISGLSRTEAKTILFSELEQKLDLELGQMIKNKQDEATLNAKKLAEEIIINSIERYAGDIISERSTSIVKLPNEDMKGRVIGKEGRNIKTFELITGTDIIIDDTPDFIQVSSFNPLRREIAIRTLETLMKDGRIQPVRIEETFNKVTKELEVTIQNVGQNAIQELGIINMHPELVYYVGRLKFRTSFGQNVLQHSMEVARIASQMALELGLDGKIACRAGLLHDIGKALDYEIEGSHVEVGLQLARKYGENKIILNAIHSHHGEVPADNVYSVLVAAADTLSAARPGARSNSAEDFIQRMKQIEDICQEIEGVKKSYAVQSGRQVRIIVDPGKVDDLKVYKIANDVKEKIEKNVKIPGDIHITVIRELRVNEIAK